MANFDFSNLSPQDFEHLTRDLLQADEGIRLESFKTGRDGGIDFRYAPAESNMVVQCKHYKGTGLAGLLRELTKEVVKLRNLAPDRYILSTSVSLNPNDKNKIIQILDNVPNSGDILGKDDLDNLLDKNPAVVKSHFKLWLASSAILDTVIHKASVTQSNFDAKRVYREIRRYVPSAAFPRALEILDKDRVVIISGLPGVGKTTLARMLLYTHLEKSYEVISILDDFNAARARFDPGLSQIFYFDDFLGATFLGERETTLTRNEDRAILDFVEIIRDSKKSRLVLTTREHILTQAFESSEKLKNSTILDVKCVLEIGDYNFLQKAEILYNHIYFSDLPYNYIEQLLNGRFYKAIIEHKKYSPRLIEWLSSYQRVSRIPVDEYTGFVESLLENPVEIWKHAYERQISESGRSILLALYTLGGSAKAPQLSRAFRSIHSTRSKKYGFVTKPSDERLALRELSESFIRTRGTIEFIDPSVIDMINAVLCNDPENAIDLIDGAMTFAQSRRVLNTITRSQEGSARNHIKSEIVRVQVALERLLKSPTETKVDNSAFPIDDSPELRMITMIELSDSLQSHELKNLTEKSLQTLLREWKSKAPDLDEGLMLYRAIRDSSFTFFENKLAVFEPMLTVLTNEARTDCTSENLIELIELNKHCLADEKIAKNLYQAGIAYRSTGFYNDLQNCASESEYDALEQNLEFFIRETKFNFSAPLQIVRSDRQDFIDDKSDYEDHMYDEWKEERSFEQYRDGQLDVLFSSLRKTT